MIHCINAVVAVTVLIMLRANTSVSQLSQLSSHLHLSGSVRTSQKFFFKNPLFEMSSILTWLIFIPAWQGSCAQLTRPSPVIKGLVDNWGPSHWNMRNMCPKISKLIFCRFASFIDVADFHGCTSCRSFLLIFLWFQRKYILLFDHVSHCNWKEEMFFFLWTKTRKSDR